MTDNNTTELAAVAAAELTAKPQSIKATVLAQFKEAETTLTALAEKYRAVAFDVTTTKGMAEAKAARADLRDNGRLHITKTAQGVKDDVNDLKRIMDGEVARLVAIVKPHEDAIDAQIKAEEKRKEEAKAEKARIEAERIAKHQAGLDKIAAYPKLLEGRTLQEMEDAIAKVEAVTIGESWEEFADQATQALANALAGMRDVADRERMRLENERMASELQAQREQLARQADELMRQRVAATVFTFPEPQQQKSELAEWAQQAFDAIEAGVQSGALTPEVAGRFSALASEIVASDAIARASETSAVASQSASDDETSPVVTTGVLCDRLGLTLRAEFIQSLGFAPVPCPGRGTYWKESDIKPIGLAIIEFIKERIND